VHFDSLNYNLVTIPNSLDFFNNWKSNLPTLPSPISLSFTDHSGLSSQIPSTAFPPLSYIPLSQVRQLTTKLMIMVILPALSPPLQTAFRWANQELAELQATQLITLYVYRVSVAEFNRTAVMEMVI